MVVDPDSLKDRSRTVSEASQTIGDNVSDEILEAANPDTVEIGRRIDDPDDTRSKLERIRAAKDD